MKRTLFVGLTSLLLALLLSSCMGDKKMTYTVALTTGAEVHVVVAPTAAGAVSVTLNETTKMLMLSGSYEGLTGAATAAHIHAPVAADANAGVVFTLAVTEDATTTGKGSLELAETAITDEQIKDLKAGLYYVNVHTTANAAGEVRGQIK